MAAPAPTTQDKTKEVLQQINDVEVVMQSNINKIVQNTADLESLQIKSEQMKDSSAQFKKSATELKKTMWWQNLKIKIIIGLVIGAILLIIILSITLPLVGK